MQVIPHVTDEIKRRIQKLDADYDIIITEIGGTVGDIEILPFLEAVRQLRLDLGLQNTLYVMLTYIPFIHAAGELKTKPSQHSAYKLREIGIQPEILLCRSEKPVESEIYDKIALFTNVPRANVINAIDVDMHRNDINAEFGCLVLADVRCAVGDDMNSFHDMLTSVLFFLFGKPRDEDADARCVFSKSRAVFKCLFEKRDTRDKQK